ncbi:thioredoxin domain-containing protein [Rhizobium leguminosarum bv. trifolii WSM2297]|uniref:Thioredoxin domain-containing protein n=1 Tax=Rhizobium leguminosarum bv. trifolii WSM2297 TaxID=754762 RepID=J0CMG0_RHILT|nr:thioredoxin domain-containing protein [Rhizobium leguminosarum]EJC80730.1 thioredoxin domain-containing protein [Rhizobium leguminosarum bv. trifolii WSM2297]
MTSLKSVNARTFHSEVVKSKRSFSSISGLLWSQSCTMIAPILEEIAGEMKGIVKFVKLNVDKNPQLTARFGVVPTPTLKIFHGGKGRRTFSAQHQSTASSTG